MKKKKNKGISKPPPQTISNYATDTNTQYKLVNSICTGTHISTCNWIIHFVINAFRMGKLKGNIYRRMWKRFFCDEGFSIILMDDSFPFKHNIPMYGFFFSFQNLFLCQYWDNQLLKFIFIKLKHETYYGICLCMMYLCYVFLNVFVNILIHRQLMFCALFKISFCFLEKTIYGYRVFFSSQIQLLLILNEIDVTKKGISKAFKISRGPKNL